MKIVALQAENIKRLVAVEIRPNGNMVQITGRNGQGKTSVLDAIWWALAGLTNVQKMPIRNGATTARIRLDLGEIVVNRSFAAIEGTDNYTSSITVTSAKGAKFPTPQTMLDKLLGQLSFDPLEFSRMTAREQFEALRRFVPDVDFDAIDRANDLDYAERTSVNRKAHEARIYAEKMDVNKNAPNERVDESALVQALADASAHNSDISTRAERREQLAVQFKQHQEFAENYRAQADALRKRADEAEQKATEIQTRLVTAPPLPQPVNVSAIQEKIDEAKAHNAQVDLFEKNRELIVEAEQHEDESKQITLRMNQREADRQAKIAAAKMPVPGISFGKGFILLNGLPFEQASDAEQLRVSVALAMALNPTLRVLRVRDGSLLDSDSMRLVSEMIEAQDYQLWIERVDSSGTVGFVLEDGKLKANGATREVAQHQEA